MSAGARRQTVGYPRSALVERPRLEARLDEAFGRRLTTVVGGAGYGKTTLLAEWARDVQSGWHTASRPTAGSARSRAGSCGRCGLSSPTWRRTPGFRSLRRTTRCAPTRSRPASPGSSRARSTTTSSSSSTTSTSSPGLRRPGWSRASSARGRRRSTSCSSAAAIRRFRSSVCAARARCSSSTRRCSRSGRRDRRPPRAVPRCGRTRPRAGGSAS